MFQTTDQQRIELMGTFLNERPLRKRLALETLSMQELFRILRSSQGRGDRVDRLVDPLARHRQSAVALGDSFEEYQSIYQ